MTAPSSQRIRIKARSIVMFSGALAGCALLIAPNALAQRIGTTSQPLTTSTAITNWTTMNNEIPVCWETGGWDREKRIIRQALASTWELYGNLRFTGWGSCPTTGKARHVRVRIQTQAKDAKGNYPNSGGDGSARLGTGALSSAEENNPGMNLSFSPGGTAGEKRVEYIAVHEFGHVLGFEHEQDAPGNEGPERCTSGVDKDRQGTAVAITGYDRDSIMNYCNRDGNGTGYLTDIDIIGVQRIYGAREPLVTRVNSCASAPMKGRVSVAAPWNNNGKATFAVFPNDGTKFLYHSQWAIQDGGWGDEVKWMAGDFNGDGKTDIGAVWNNGGNNVLTVRLSTGKGFAQQHWHERAGGWINSSRWMAGDFNGDGKADMAGAWNNGGQVSIAVFLSDGTKFPGWTQWSDRDGGWGDEVKWFAGDFNGDGKTDIGAAWNNNGRVTLTVRLSLGNRFSHVHWNADAGRWFNTSVFVAGDFNGDGRDDVAQIWNDMGTVSINTYRSTGSSFGGPVAAATRDGGWSGQVIRWMTGDFDGDGRIDLNGVWNNNGTNVLTVRRSDGARFGHAHWSTNAGGWIPSTAWCVGNFEGTYSGGAVAVAKPGAGAAVIPGGGSAVAAGGPAAGAAAVVRGEFSAFATDGRGRWGYAVHQPNDAGARSGAVNGCGGSSIGCKVFWSTRDRCVAYAESRQSGYWYAAGGGGDQAQAQQNALRFCQSGTAPANSCKAGGVWCR